MTKNRIHIATGDPLSRKGGLNTVVASLSNAQRELGFNVQVIDELRMQVRRKPNSKENWRKEINKFKSKASSESLVEYHFAQTALLTFPIFASPNTKSIFHFHGPWFLEGRVQGDSRMRVAAKRFIEQVVYKNQTVMTTHSEAFKDLLMSEFHLPEEKIHVVYPGVDLTKFQIRDKTFAQKAFGLDTGKKVLLCIRRLEPRMGIHLAIDAVEHFPDCVLVIAGTGSLNQSLREYAAAKSYSDRIKFLGVVDEDKHALIFSAADLVVVPTLSFEGFGLVVWEAFAAGVPVVASRVGGLTEALGSFSQGYGFETGSVVDFVDKIRFALASESTANDFRSSVADRTWINTALAIEAIASEAYGSASK